MPQFSRHAKAYIYSNPFAFTAHALAMLQQSAAPSFLQDTKVMLQQPGPLYNTPGAPAKTL